MYSSQIEKGRPSFLIKQANPIAEQEQKDTDTAEISSVEPNSEISREERKRIELQAETDKKVMKKLIFRVSEDDLTIKEHLEYLRSKQVIENMFSVVTLLNSLYRRMQVKYEIEDRDDL